MSKMVFCQYEKRDGTTATIEGTLENITANAARIVDDGGRVLQIREIPMFQPGTSMVGNASSPPEDVLVMPSSLATNALETPAAHAGLNSPDARNVPQAPAMFYGAQGGSPSSAVGNEDADDVLEMPAINWSENGRQSANVGGSQAEETLALPSMGFDASKGRKRKRA